MEKNGKDLGRLIVTLNKHEYIQIGETRVFFKFSEGKPKLVIEAPREISITRVKRDEHEYAQFS